MRIVDSKSDVEVTLDRRTRRIRDCFERGAGSYDRFADVQAGVAVDLAATISACRHVDQIETGLEIGCGTGFLTDHLVHQFSEADWSITDLSPAMLECCQIKMAAKTGGEVELSPSDRVINFQVEDGQHPTLAGPFDLICSNLTFQWFSDLERSVTEWASRLADGGCLAFNVIGAGSFGVWREAYAVDPRVPEPSSFPSIIEIGKRLESALGAGPGKFSLTVDERQFLQTKPSFRQFFLGLKKIGANALLGATAPRFGQLRDWLSVLDSSPVTINYNVLTVVIEKERPRP